MSQFRYVNNIITLTITFRLEVRGHHPKPDPVSPITRCSRQSFELQVKQQSQTGPVMI